MMVYAGCDPGLEGYVCVGQDHAPPTKPTLTFIPCPVTDGASREVYDQVGMLEVGIRLVRLGVEVVVLEEQQAYPGHGPKCISCGKPAHMQGVASTFKTGVGFGSWQTAFLAAGLRVVVVPAQEWKKPFGLDADKKKSVAKAKQIRPDVDFRAVERTPKARKSDHNKAESFLLAVHGRKLLKRSMTACADQEIE